MFITDKGFSVSIDRQPFSSIDIWSEENTLHNNLGSVKSAIAYVIMNTLKMLEEFTDAICKVVAFPPDIAPGYNVYVRGEHTKTLIEAQGYIDETPWTDSAT